MWRYWYLLNPRTMLLGPLLLYRVTALCLYLQDRGIPCQITKYLRKRPTAHRWSTAHHVVTGQISLGALRQLKAGRDLDGNLWYRPEWDPGQPDMAGADIAPAIVANAIQQGPPNTVYAEEGYAPGDPRRLPNLSHVPVSKHVAGLAVDLLVDWQALDGPWSASACATVARFGLLRPVNQESWHFELDSGRWFVVWPHQVVAWAIRRRRRAPAWSD